MKAGRIALVGFRGCGKTTVGRLLAERLGWAWLDADEVLERRAGRSIRSIFAADGEAAFRDLEAQILAELCGLDRHVLATGGGVVLRPENRELLRRSAWTVWLDADAETVWRRLQGDPTSAARRPALAVGGPPPASAANSLEEIAALLKTREPLYRACADLIVPAAGRDPSALADEILAACRRLFPAGERRNPAMATHHSPRFLQLVNEARGRILETTVDEVKAMLDRGEAFHLIDVREESEWAKDHLPRAVHLGKGVLERDIEQRLPDTSAPIVLYCGGGYRSALAADNLTRMGYTDVRSMDGGIRDWRAKGYPLTTD